MQGDVFAATRAIRRGADVNWSDDRGACALLMASKNGHKEVVQILLSAGASVDKQARDSGTTSLMMATVKGHTGVVQVLISARSSVNHSRNDGATPWFLASQFVH